MVEIVEERNAMVLGLSWRPDGKYLASCGSDGVLKVLQIGEEVAEIARVKKERTVRRCEWSPDGKFIAIACFDGDGAVYRFDEEQLQLDLVGELSGHESEVKTARWSADGSLILTCSRDKSIWVWSSSDYDFIAIHNEHGSDVKDAVFSPDQKLIASVSFDGTMRIWATDEELGALQTFSDHNGTVWTVAFNQTNDDILTLGEDGKAILYTKDTDGSYEKDNEIRLQAELQPLYTVLYSHERWLIAGSEQKVYVVSSDLSEVVKTLAVETTGDINAIAQDPLDENRIAVGCDDGLVMLLTLC